MMTVTVSSDTRDLLIHCHRRARSIAEALEQFTHRKVMRDIDSLHAAIAVAEELADDLAAITTLVNDKDGAQ